MFTDVIANSIPELIQFYWQRIERFHWLPDSAEGLLNHLLLASTSFYNPDTPAQFFNHMLPASHKNQHSKTILFCMWIRPALARLVRQLTAANVTSYYIPWDDVHRLPNRGLDRVTRLQAV